MKAVYKTTALDRIYAIATMAEANQMEVDYVLVTPEEWSAIRRDCREPSSYSFNGSDKPCFTTVDLNRKGDPKGLHRYRFIVEPFTVYGLRIVVAPKEYH